MAQPLARPQPTSSVAAMLERGVGAAVIGKASPAGEATTPDSCGDACSGALLKTVPRQFLLSPAADGTLKRLQAIFTRTTGLELRQSELMRAILLAMDAMSNPIEREAAIVGPLRRPKNGVGSEAAQMELERRIAAAFVVACEQRA